MVFRFPVKGVDINITVEKRVIENPSYSDYYVSLNQREFVLDIEGIACFYARNGNHIDVMPYKGADHSVVELYLNGSVYGAILHQRKTLPLHGSCFNYQNRGIMICGESGVGKSSLTASFCLNGADFLTDDITPIVFKEGIPTIWVMSDRIKLHADSLTQLNQPIDELTQIGPDWAKFYFPMKSVSEETVALHHIFVLHVHDQPDVSVRPLAGIEKFAALRNELYRGEYLRGMPESEADYLTQLILLSQHVSVTKISRPAEIPIEQLRAILEKHILSIEAKQDQIMAHEQA